MSDKAREGEKTKPTLGQAIDQVISALGFFEGSQQQTILRAVYAHLGIDAPKAEAQRREGAPAREEQPRPAPKGGSKGEYAGMDIRTFKEEKNPNSARQMACVVAYYLGEIAEGDEHKDFVTSADIEKYFKQAKFQLPTKLEQLLIDCKGSGYFESPARGEYKLTRVGHNLVAHQLGKGKG
ncbi:MAG TPA: hypothetical protein VHC71_15380 [Hyphomicrobium sp.]|jgi:hypothetical protein|nr:hypothetical protein [Hyphomicrobium sp.]